MASSRVKLPKPPQAVSHTRYEDDLYTWVQQQVELLQTGKLTEIDALNIAEELSDVGKMELHRLASAIEVLTQHLLKWDHQPKRRSRSWELSVREQRLRIQQTLEDNPGLKNRLDTALARGYVHGRNRALAETKLPDAAMPEACPYSFDEMMTRKIAFEPSSPRKHKAR